MSAADGRRGQAAVAQQVRLWRAGRSGSAAVSGVVRNRRHASAAPLFARRAAAEACGEVFGAGW
ncbi:hypothetical protein D8771_03445 [Streptomyces albus]|uniref:Uncharacterized protein n=1 Tax=Streptomyces albus TaxID=1888 RepID=A0A8H1LLG4_9ACTN|nr:hypothetical protein D8771_03445 [Streptomyces albus]